MRTVPINWTASGITLNAPTWLVSIEHTLTTIASSGLTLRLAMVCSAVMICAATTTGIDGEVRHRCVTALAPYLDADLVGCREDRAGAHRDLSRRQPRPVMQRIDLVRRKALEQAFLHHDVAAAAMFLCRLEDDVGGAGEVARLGEVARCTQQHGGMAVVSAGVHAPVVSRLVRPRGGLVHRQAIHVGAQAHRAARPACGRG